MRRAWGVAFAAWAAAGAWAQPVASRFDSGDEGWTFYNDGTAFAWNATVGNPPGSIFCRDRGSGTYWGYLAPAAFHGDLSGAYGAGLSFHIRPTAVDTGGNAQPDVALVGGGLTLVIDLANPAPNTWNQYEVELAPAAGWKVSTLTGAGATEPQVRQVLGAVTALRIRGEFRSGADEAYLDNVLLGGERCYANCDKSTGPVLLDIFDFLCFQNSFAAQEGYACDCDTIGGSGLCDIFDFLCFQNAFAAGCP